MPFLRLACYSGNNTPPEEDQHINCCIDVTVPVITRADHVCAAPDVDVPARLVMAACLCIVQQLLQSQSEDLALHDAIPFEQRMEKKILVTCK